MVSNTGARNSKGDYTLSMKLRNSSSLISATSAISLCRQDVRLYVEADDKTMKISRPHHPARLRVVRVTRNNSIRILNKVLFPPMITFKKLSTAAIHMFHEIIQISVLNKVKRT